jgi:hypothetical protein
MGWLLLPESLKIHLSVLLPYFVQMYLVIELHYSPDNAEHCPSNEKDFEQAHNRQEKLQEYGDTNDECQQGYPTHFTTKFVHMTSGYA